MDRQNPRSHFIGLSLKGNQYGMPFVSFMRWTGRSIARSFKVPYFGGCRICSRYTEWMNFNSGMNINGPDGHGPVQPPPLQNVLHEPVVAHVKLQKPPGHLMLQSASPAQVISQ
jgi:hypothetical protein